MLTILIFAVLLLFILIDLPIVVAIALTAVVFFVGLGQGSFLTMLPQRMYSGTTGFVLLAVPFFILAGNLMNTGGITSRIFRFAKALFGHVPGGLGHVSVVSSMIFSGMSGSAVADAAGLGQIQHKAMVDNGYRPAISASIVASSSTIGPVIPPSIPFVLYGIFRYLYLIHKKGEGGNPENILATDKPLLASIFLWVVTAGMIIYL